MHLDLHAPKVAIPITDQQDDAGQPVLQTLFVDLGSLVITSNQIEASSLSPEEAALYDCYGLLSYDIAVYVIKGPFVWPDMTRTLSGPLTDAGLVSPVQPGDARRRLTGQLISDYLGPSAVAVPFLGHCSTTASVHVAHASHPTLPFVRVGLEVCIYGSTSIWSVGLAGFCRMCPHQHLISCEVHCCAGSRDHFACQSIPPDPAPACDANPCADHRCSHRPRSLGESCGVHKRGGCASVAGIGRSEQPMAASICCCLPWHSLHYAKRGIPSHCAPGRALAGPPCTSPSRGAYRCSAAVNFFLSCVHDTLLLM